MPPWCAATSSKRLNCRGVNLTPRHLRWSKLHSGERSVMGSWRPALKAMQALKISRCFISNTIFKMNQMTTGHLEKRTPTSLRIAQLQCQPIWSVRYASISNDVGQHVPKVQVKLTIPEPFWKHWALGPLDVRLAACEAEPRLDTLVTNSCRILGSRAPSALSMKVKNGATTSRCLHFPDFGFWYLENCQSAPSSWCLPFLYMEYFMCICIYQIY